MNTLTVFRLTPLGLVHTILCIANVAVAAVALIQDKEITPKSRFGRGHLVLVFLVTVTGLPIVRFGKIGPPHILGFLTLGVLALGLAAHRLNTFGRLSRYVATISFSATVLFLAIPTVTETLTRVPPGAPILPGPNSPFLQAANAALLALFLVAATLQVRRLRAMPAAA